MRLIVFKPELIIGFQSHENGIINSNCRIAKSQCVGAIEIMFFVKAGMFVSDEAYGTEGVGF